MIKELTLSAIFGLVACHPTIGHPGGHYGPPQAGYGHSYGPSKYSFAYGIHDTHYGPNFGHSESRDGYATKGQYYVHLPDGRLQKVKYHADQHGYHPHVSYSGKAHFPSHGKGHHHPPVHGYH